MCAPSLKVNVRMESSGPEMSIGELAERFGLATHVLRHWEDVGPLRPARRVNGRRRSTPEHLTRVALILRGKDAGFSLERIPSSWPRPAARPAARPSPPPGRTGRPDRPPPARPPHRGAHRVVSGGRLPGLPPPPGAARRPRRGAPRHRAGPRGAPVALVHGLHGGRPVGGGLDRIRLGAETSGAGRRHHDQRGQHRPPPVGVGLAVKSSSRNPAVGHQRDRGEDSPGAVLRATVATVPQGRPATPGPVPAP